MVPLHQIVFKTVRVNEEDVDPMYFVEADYSSLEELANRVVGRQLVASISDFNAVWQVISIIACTRPNFALC
jgi:hypothetical protein